MRGCRRIFGSASISGLYLFGETRNTSATWVTGRIGPNLLVAGTGGSVLSELPKQTSYARSALSFDANFSLVDTSGELETGLAEVLTVTHLDVPVPTPTGARVLFGRDSDGSLPTVSTAASGRVLLPTSNAWNSWNDVGDSPTRLAAIGCSGNTAEADGFAIGNLATLTPDALTAIKGQIWVAVALTVATTSAQRLEFTRLVRTCFGRAYRETAREVVKRIQAAAISEQPLDLVMPLRDMAMGSYPGWGVPFAQYENCLNAYHSRTREGLWFRGGEEGNGAGIGVEQAGFDADTSWDLVFTASVRTARPNRGHMLAMVQTSRYVQGGFAQQGIGASINSSGYVCITGPGFAQYSSGVADDGGWHTYRISHRSGTTSLYRDGSLLLSVGWSFTRGAAIVLGAMYVDTYDRRSSDIVIRNVGLVRSATISAYQLMDIEDWSYTE